MAQTREIYCFTDLEAKRSKTEVLIGLLPSKERHRFHDFPAAFGGLLAIFRVPGLVDTALQLLPSHSVLPVCVSVSKLPHFIKTPLILD